MTLRTLNYGNYGIFLIMGNAGFCPSAVVRLACGNFLRSELPGKWKGLYILGHFWLWDPKPETLQTVWHEFKWLQGLLTTVRDLISQPKPPANPNRLKTQWTGKASNAGALIIRIGFWGPLYYSYNKESPR